VFIYLVFNGFYSSFGISGHFLASHTALIFLQYPPFSNLQRCLSLWLVQVQLVEGPLVEVARNGINVVLVDKGAMGIHLNWN